MEAPPVANSSNPPGTADAPEKKRVIRSGVRLDTVALTSPYGLPLLVKLTSKYQNLIVPPLSDDKELHDFIPRSMDLLVRVYDEWRRSFFPTLPLVQFLVKIEGLMARKEMRELMQDATEGNIEFRCQKLHDVLKQLAEVPVDARPALRAKLLEKEDFAASNDVIPEDFDVNFGFPEPVPVPAPVPSVPPVSQPETMDMFFEDQDDINLDDMADFMV